MEASKGVDQTDKSKQSNYYEEKNIKPMLQHYLKKIIVDKPSDPLTYLKNAIETDPYKA